MLDGAAMTALEMIQEEDKAERTPRWTAATARGDKGVAALRS